MTDPDVPIPDISELHTGQPAGEESGPPAPVFASLDVGDPAPWFQQRATSHPTYSFQTTGGRYVVLCFHISAGDSQGRAAIDAISAHADRFDDDHICCFSVSVDPADESSGRVQARLPGVRVFWDFDGRVSRLYGAIPRDVVSPTGKVATHRVWLVLDPMLRIIAKFPFTADGSERAHLFAFLDRLPPPSLFAGFELPAPVLVLSNVLERDFCDRLIGLYETDGGHESGFMQEVNGKTVIVHDHARKRRRDYNIDNPDLIRQLQARVKRRIVPEIQKVHQFTVTRMERYLVACYAAEDGAHFFMHRDNTTKGTAHRRFAVSINLNDDFDGGEISFPEYSRRGFKITAGGAVVFSCSLLHEVSTVTRGRRYAFLPFLYDDAAAKLRAANNVHLGEGVAAYRGG